MIRLRAALLFLAVPIVLLLVLLFRPLYGAAVIALDESGAAFSVMRDLLYVVVTGDDA